MTKQAIFLFSILLLSLKVAAQQIRVGTFYANVTPPIGSPVAYAQARSIQDSLSARGIVILSDQKPIVICAVDWIGISNEGQEVFKSKIAKAADTTPDRVSVHALHQHDGPACDFTIAKILTEYGLGGKYFNNEFLYSSVDRIALAVKKAKDNAQSVSHVGFGESKVEKVASTRRVMGADGNVAFTRWSSATDSLSMAAPEGLIDPFLKSLSFWNEDKPLVVMSFYATHPQSHYGDGDVSCEFVGIARNDRQITMKGIPNIYFTGASGNIAAGKYNNGSDTTRYVLAKRIESAMEKAWKDTKKKRISFGDLSWKSEAVSLPLGKNILEKDLRATLSDHKKTPLDKYAAAEKLAWLLRTKDGYKASVSALRIGNVWLLNLPGETFVEYQLAAQKLKPKGHVCTAAYEEYGPGYIGTKASYSQGGYETSDLNSGVSADAEAVLMEAIAKVLK